MLFTVPSGSPVASAILEWLSPPKYDRRMTVLCGSPKEPSARRTSPPAMRDSASSAVWSQSTSGGEASSRSRAAWAERTRSMARLRAMVVSQARTLPRPGS